MKPKEQIKKFLKNYPGLDVIENTNLIAVLSHNRDGFDVAFEETWKNYIISFGQWNEYLPKDSDGARLSIELFKFGLSDSCRLRLYSKGEAAYKCVLEYIDIKKNTWVNGAKLSSLLYPFCLSNQEEIEVLGNKFINGSDLTPIYSEIKHERKHANFKFFYFISWLVIFLKLNDFDLSKIHVSFLLLFPVIAITLILPIFIIDNWFNDRKFGKRKKFPLTKKEKYFLYLWFSIWFLGFLVICIFWGIGNLVILCIIFLPLIIVGFCLPIFLYFQNVRNGKKD